MSDEERAFEDAAPVEIDPQKLEFAFERLKSRQSLGKAVVAGAIAAAVGAALWAALTVAFEVQIGFMAIGIGFLVGFAVRKAGRGVTPSFRVAGAALALAGCAVGNLLAVLGLVSKTQGIPFGDILVQLTPALAVDLMKASFSPMDLVFYAIAVYEGWQLSAHQLTVEDLEAAEGNVPIEP